MKYQHAWEFSPEGATYRDVFRAADTSSAPLQNKLTLLRWVIFNYLIGNTNAHAKNISFFLDHQGLHLTPFYDLVSGTIYGLKKMAMFIAREEEIGLVDSYDWLDLCKQIGIAPALLGKQMHNQVQLWKKAKPKLLADKVYTAAERKFLQQMTDDFEARALILEEHVALLTAK